MKPVSARQATMQRQGLAMMSALLLLAGCSGGLKSNLPPAQIYLLRPGSAPAAGATSAPTAAVFRSCRLEMLDMVLPPVP